jgi:carboxylesterase type B
MGQEMTDQPTVSTSLGTLRGCVEEELSVFRGVPYAAPPTGAARWKAARPHPGWLGVRAATEYGLSAPQPWMPGGMPPLGEHGAPPFGEDCLTLNLWTPGIDDARRPVMVWIHGGGFLTGSGNLPFYACDTFARDGDVVAISINYRLGPLGFLSGVGDPNVWLTDQVAALQWIAANVAAFGGDPARITLAGQSGGAFSIAALAQHPVARGLFHRGILQSPPLGLELPTTDQALHRTMSLARHLGHEDLRALRQESWERLIGGTIGVLGEYAQFGEWGLAYLPVIDDATMPSPPGTALASSDIDILIGWTRDEASFAFGANPQYAGTTREQVTGWASARHGERAGALFDAYATAAADSSPRQVLTEMVTDGLFRCGALELADARSASRHVHAYQFDVPSPMLGGALGAAHCMELPFAFANISRWGPAPLFTGLGPEVVERVTAAVHGAWIGFVRDGQPGRQAVSPWPPYTASDRSVLVIGPEAIRAETNMRRPAVCASA